MMLGLGIGTYGIARMLTHGRWLTSLLIITAGIGFAALIRPHIAGIWIAATLPGLAVALFGRSRVGGRRKPNKFGFLIVLGIGTAMFALLASTTVGYLAPSSDDEGAKTNSLTDILEETTRRTAQADSSFTPPSVSNPIAWPYASIRTLTRPLPFEARTATQLISAAEMTALLGICVLSRKRIRNLPRLLVSNPYVAFVLSALFLAGLAYTSLANLGILTRQKSLLMPFLVLLPCLPARTMRRPDDEKSATQRGDGFRGQLIDSNQPRESLDTGWRISPPQHLETVPGRVIARSPAYDDGEDLWN